MGRFRINTAAPNLVNICIDCVKEGEYSGRIFHKYSDKEIPFHESGHMISILDQFYNKINYPQASTKYRSFQKRKKEVPDLTDRSKEEVKQVRTADEMLKPRGKEATFILHVQYRQNSTWQGKLIWMEEDDEEAFSSVLEILKLLDSALERE